MSCDYGLWNIDFDFFLELDRASGDSRNLYLKVIEDGIECPAKINKQDPWVV